MKDNVPLHFTVSPKLKAKLEKRAKHHGMTVAGLLRVLIARECEQK
jgi:hypothetical protein